MIPKTGYIIFSKISSAGKAFRSRLGSFRYRFPKINLSWDHPARWLDTIVTMTLKLGTLALVLFLIIFISRLFQKQGFVIEPFSVPESFDQSGYTGSVIASKIHDEVLIVKEIGQSVKADSVKLIGNDRLEFDLSVMGVGVSLNSIAYHIREMFGRKNEVIYGEIIQVDSTLSLTLRMSGYPSSTQEVKISGGDRKAAIKSLLRRGGEIVLGNCDPYRLAVYCFREQRYEEAIELARQIIQERPQEVHWAYLGWGSVLEEQNRHEEAILKFRRAMEVKPDFALAYVRQSWSLSRMGKKEEALAMMEKALDADPSNVERWVNLGWMLWSRGYKEKADSAFRRAAAIAPGEQYVWVNWANSKMESGRMKEALPLVEKAEALAGENAEGYITKAMGSYARKDTLQAYRYLETALDFDPGLPNAIEANIFVNWRNKDYPEVIRIFEKSDLSRLNRYTRQRVLNVVAMSYNYIGHQEAAFETARQSIAVDPTTGYPYTTLAEIYALSGDMEKFYQNMEKSLQRGFSSRNINWELEPYASLRKDARLKALMEEYGHLKG